MKLKFISIQDIKCYFGFHIRKYRTEKWCIENRTATFGITRPHTCSNCDFESEVFHWPDPPEMPKCKPAKKDYYYYPLEPRNIKTDNNQKRYHPLDPRRIEKYKK